MVFYQTEKEGVESKQYLVNDLHDCSKDPILTCIQKAYLR